MRSLSLLLTGAVALLALPVIAQAQTPAQAPAGTPMRIRGTVERLDGRTLTLKEKSGGDRSIALAADCAVSGVAKRHLSDIKAGDYIASTSVKGTDGKYHALEIHIFPEAMRGVAEGQFPWDLTPGSLMTNATVAGVTGAPKGKDIKVNWHGKSFDVEVAPTTPIVTFVPGDTSLLKPGAAVFVFALKRPDGTLTASRITAEKDGVKPPM